MNHTLTHNGASERNFFLRENCGESIDFGLPLHVHIRRAKPETCTSIWSKSRNWKDKANCFTPRLGSTVFLWVDSAIAGSPKKKKQKKIALYEVAQFKRPKWASKADGKSSISSANTAKCNPGPLNHIYHNTNAPPKIAIDENMYASTLFSQTSNYLWRKNSRQNAIKPIAQEISIILHPIFFVHAQSHHHIAIRYRRCVVWKMPKDESVLAGKWFNHSCTHYFAGGIHGHTVNGQSIEQLNELCMHIN